MKDIEHEIKAEVFGWQVAVGRVGALLDQARDTLLRDFDFPTNERAIGMVDGGISGAMAMLAEVGGALEAMDGRLAMRSATRSRTDAEQE